LLLPSWELLVIYQNYLAPQPQDLTLAPAIDEEPSQFEIVSAEGKVIPASQVGLGFLQAGRVAEVLVQEGESVQIDDPLIRLDSASYEAAVAQAEAVVETAQASLDTALTRVEQVRQAGHLQETTNRTSAWTSDEATEFDLPGWYYDKEQQIASAATEVENAAAYLETEKANLQAIMADVRHSDFLAAELHLADAQAEYLVAKAVNDKATSSPDGDLRQEARSLLDVALSRLDAAQEDYENALESDEATKVLEGRARLTVAQERYDSALDRLNAYNTGDQSLELKVAEESVRQARAA
jgi:pyruvate/2-oxoglutarate dehydrogenase complex dihydrolipoamide acyltransferase (E2) component